jgi:integrase
VILEYLDQRPRVHTPGETAARELCARISRDLGHLPLETFDGPAGNIPVLEYLSKLWARGIGPHTCRNYVSQVFAILVWAKDSGYIAALPRQPRQFSEDGSPVYQPRFEHWTEADFRIFRERWAEGALAHGSFGRAHGPGRTAWIDLAAKRSLYLSVAFYTGMHNADLDKLTADWLPWQVGRYRRENQKSARCVAPASFDMPEQLQADCAAEVKRLGRDWTPGELVAGGPWPRPEKVLHNAWRRLWPESHNRPPAWTFRLARRSTAWEYAVRGWTVQQISEILGHVDCAMVRTVYLRCSELGLIPATRQAWRIGTAPGGAPRTSRAKVLAFG